MNNNDMANQLLRNYLLISSETRQNVKKLIISNYQ